jgi:hypothetical protein
MDFAIVLDSNKVVVSYDLTIKFALIFCLFHLCVALLQLVTKGALVTYSLLNPLLILQRSLGVGYLKYHCSLRSFYWVICTLQNGHLLHLEAFSSGQVHTLSLQVLYSRRTTVVIVRRCSNSSIIHVH